MAERNFYEEAGFEMPEGVGALASDNFQYFQQQPGLYRGIFGKLKPLYRDANNKSVDTPPSLGALPYTFLNYLWITQFLGTSSAPEKKDICVVKDDKVIIPIASQAAELYFTNFISYLPKDQWSVQKKFESFIIPGYEKIRIVQPDPQNPTRKITSFTHFPHYYGFNVEFTLGTGKQTGKPYLDTIKLITTVPKISTESMKEFEAEVDSMIQREIEARKAKKDEGYKPSAPEVTDFSSFIAGDDKPTDDGLDGFLNS